MSSPKVRYPEQVPIGKDIESGQRAIQDLLEPGAEGEESRAGRTARLLAEQELELTGRFGPLFQDLQTRLLERDPLMGGLRSAAISGLEGLSGGRMPADYERTLTQHVRRSQAARGVLGSPGSAVEEAARLMGGSESIRERRLGQAASLLGLAPQAPTVSPGQFIPGQADILGQISGMRGQMLGQRFQTQMLRQAERQGWGEFVGNLIGTVAPLA